LQSIGGSIERAGRIAWQRAADNAHVCAGADVPRAHWGVNCRPSCRAAEPQFISARLPVQSYPRWVG